MRRHLAYALLSAAIGCAIVFLQTLGGRDPVSLTRIVRGAPFGLFI